MKNNGKGILEGAFPLAALTVALLAPTAAHANSCTVTSLADSGPGTLRALIADTTCDPINFGNFVFPATITLTSGELVFARSVTINGPGASQMIVKRDSNAPAFGIFRIDSGIVAINGLTITNGRGFFDYYTFVAGGGIAVRVDNLGPAATLILTGSTVSGNAGVLSGGIFGDGTLKIINSTISGNVCQFDNCSGGIWAVDLTLNGSTVSGNGGSSAGGIYTAGQSSITNSKISDNSSGGDGGGIRNDGTLTITGSTISGNSSGFIGGGINNTSSATALTLINSTVSGNTITPFDYYNDQGGGGIYTEAPLEVINSSFSGNIGGGGISVALFNCVDSIKVAVTDSTFSGNIGGSAQYANSITNRTFATGSPNCGLAYVTLKNTILTAASGPNCMMPGPNPRGGVFLPITDGGYNLENGNTCGFTAASSKPSTDPLLGPLQDNGGPTKTHALLTGSPAIDKGTCTDLNNNTVATDQRGVTRPQGFGCDIGAYEYRPPYPFAGFFQPVDNSPTKNVVKAGAAVPVKFSLGGDRGLNIFAANSPSSQPTACDFTSPSSDIDVTVAAGGSSLSYDSSTGTYTYVWKTDQSWSGTCRQLIVKLNDDTTHVANFQFK